MLRYWIHVSPVHLYVDVLVSLGGARQSYCMYMCTLQRVYVPVRVTTRRGGGVRPRRRGGRPPRARRDTRYVYGASYFVCLRTCTVRVWSQVCSLVRCAAAE